MSPEFVEYPLSLQLSVTMCVLALQGRRSRWVCVCEKPTTAFLTYRTPAILYGPQSCSACTARRVYASLSACVSNCVCVSVYSKCIGIWLEVGYSLETNMKFNSFILILGEKFNQFECNMKLNWSPPGFRIPQPKSNPGFNVSPQHPATTYSTMFPEMLFSGSSVKIWFLPTAVFK